MIRDRDDHYEKIRSRWLPIGFRISNNSRVVGICLISRWWRYVELIRRYSSQGSIRLTTECRIAARELSQELPSPESVPSGVSGLPLLLWKISEISRENFMGTSCEAENLNLLKGTYVNPFWKLVKLNTTDGSLSGVRHSLLPATPRYSFVY